MRHIIIVALFTMMLIPLALAENCVLKYSESSKEGVASPYDGKTIYNSMDKAVWFLVPPGATWKYLLRSNAYSDPATGKIIKRTCPEIWTDNIFGFVRHQQSFMELKYDTGSGKEELFAATDPKFTILENNSPNVKVRLDWSSDKISCSLTFSYTALDRKLMLEVEISPKSKINGYELSFFSMKPPSVIAGERTFIAEPAKDFVSIDPLTEYRIIFATEKPYALLAMPGQAKECRLNVGYHTQVKFVYGPDIPPKLTFLLYDQWKDQAEGLDYFKKLELRK